MAIDPARSAFVKNPFRFETAEDTSIRTTYKEAREIVSETNLTSTVDAQAVASNYFNLIKKPAMAFQVEVEGIYHLEDFVTGPPQFTCSFADYPADSRTYKLVGVEVDYLNNLSRLTLRGTL